MRAILNVFRWIIGSALLFGVLIYGFSNLAMSGLGERGYEEHDDDDDDEYSQLMITPILFANAEVDSVIDDQALRSRNNT